MKKIILLSVLVTTGLIATAQNLQWYPLGQGLDSIATTIDSQDSTLYISGDFTSAFGFTADNFALYINGHGVNPGTGFTGGYAKSFFNYNGVEYAGGTFNGYFRQFNPQTVAWDSITYLSSPVIGLDTFQSEIVVATDSFVMLYDTGTHLLDTLPMNFNGFLTSVTVFQNKIWMAAYTNPGDSLSNLYTWDGTTIGDSTLANRGIIYLYADNNYLFVSGTEVGGAQENDVALYSGGSFSDLSDNWKYVLLSPGAVTGISGNNPSTGYLFSGSFKLIDGDGFYHPVALYQNGILSVLGDNLKGTAYGACFNQDNVPVAVGGFSLTDTTGTYNVVVLGAASSSGIANINKRSNLLLYPNPFNNSFIVKNVTNNSTYMLYDVLGQPVATAKATSNELIFNGEQLTDGIYFLKDMSNPVNVIQIIKQ